MLDIIVIVLLTRKDGTSFSSVFFTIG